MGMYNTRVKGRQILLENPARESRAKKELEAKRAAKKKEKERKKLGIIGKKEAKEKGVWKFDESQAKWVIADLICFESLFCARFHLFLPLHKLWMGYMSELLGLPQKPTHAITRECAVKQMPNASGMHPKLLKADFHGSIMTGTLRSRGSWWILTSDVVSQSKNPCIVGLSGIVIHETENVFKVVTKDNKLKSKRNPLLMECKC